MSDLQDHPALTRLSRFEQGKPMPVRKPALMGYQPTLDGVRAVSVIAVTLYHAGFTWMHGGFFGVEVFFVVSGFLITSLLIEERDGSGKVSLWHFWLRRWRRLLPALFTMLIAIGVWAVFWGTAEQHTQVRRDYPWGIFYLANWGQVFSKVAYFSGTPTLFRHLWSLAVEEQWYLLWPVVFIVFFSRKSRGAIPESDKRRGTTLAMIALGLMAATAAAHVTKWPTKWPFFFSLDPSQWGMRPVETTNFLYLSTFTRSSGLLLGAATAFLWRPWRARKRAAASAGQALNIVAFLAVAVLFTAFAIGKVADAATYLWLLPSVTIASAALVAVLVHPAAGGARAVFGSRPLVEIGKRSYGLYLWTWPISRIVNAYDGSPDKFLLAMAIAIPVSEVCYRYIETPIRKGVLGRWWEQRQRRDWNLVTACATVSAVAVAGSMSVFFLNTDAVFDAAKDTSNTAVFDPSAIGSTVPATVPESSLVPTETTIGPPVTAATLPRRVVILGDSTAHSLAINLPVGIESTFLLTDGSLEGCTVYSDGQAVSSRDGYTRKFAGCSGWQQDWVDAAQAAQAEVALVVIGPWDVFDQQVAGVDIPFGSPTADDRFIGGVLSGINALASVGVEAALLEVPCMRPVDIPGAGVPALPERGDDARVAHVNDMLRQVAADNPTKATFIDGPKDYCTSEFLATNLNYRWDGVHPLSSGTKLTFQTIANALLAIPIG
ncbi:MAG: acyltransferase [Actinomycetia bacterium]|nr:acyltransferase [Actinomycetes bacterium]